MIINKPPNVPVRTRVDNSLKNVASCMGRMLWMEQQGGGGSNSTSLSNKGKGSTGVGINNGNLRKDNDGSRLLTTDVQMFQIGKAAQTNGFKLRLQFFHTSW
jgi:hypothetical protein